MRIRRRLRKTLGWATLLVATVLVGGGWFAYSYVTDNETLRAAIRDGAPRFLPACLVDVARVRVRPIAGEVVLTQVSIRKVEGGTPILVGQTPWVQVTYDAWAMLDGRLDLKGVVVAQPRLRLRRRLDGTWNLAGLLADPWPLPPSATSPPVEIKNGTVELVDEGDGPEASPAVILRDVTLSVSSGDLTGAPIRFEGTARGDNFELARVAGSVDRATGRVDLAGDLARLAIGETLARRLPAEARPAFRQLGLTGGDADLTVRSFSFDPRSRAIRYDASARLRAGVWACPRLPFPITNLVATVSARDGLLKIERAEGQNGRTTLRASGTVGPGDPEHAPFRIGVQVDDLEVDDRLRDWAFATFPKEAPGLFADFRPRGTVDLVSEHTRVTPDGPVDWGVTVGCRDVALQYREFQYPLEHVTGELVAGPDRITMDVHTMVGGKPLTCRGSIARPGPLSVVELDFLAESLPIDRTLREAMPADVRAVVDSFRPEGTVKGAAHLHREPPSRPGDDPRGLIAIDADLDLNPGCAITWDGLKYKVSDLTGRLEIRPTSWVFKNMKGRHGQATISGEGRVDRLSDKKDDFKVGLHVRAEDLLFESQLREALPPAWSKSWDTLNPNGSSDVDVKIEIEPGKPDHYHLDVRPRPQTAIRLRFDRVSTEVDQPGPSRVELPMEEVSGHFVFDNGTVTMTDGGFYFRNAPVRFEWGEVRVADTGQFSLKVRDLHVDDFRIDHSLRKLMPATMAGVVQSALRLNDSQTFRIRTDLDLGWSGRPGEPASVGWRDGTVILLGNNLSVGLPIRSLEGQVDHLRGGFDGRALTVAGALSLGSLNLFDVQLTEVSTPIEIVDGKLRLPSIQGTLMRGVLTGGLEADLNATPKFAADLAIDGADLQAYAKAIPGKQSFRGLVSGRLHLEGLGQDPHSLQGDGEAHVTRGDLGELPPWARPLKLLNLAPTTKTAFDQADVRFTIRNGRTSFDPIEFFGDAISLHGRGSLDTQGELDVKLRPLYSRDRWHVAGLSDAVREAEGQILVIRIKGPIAAPAAKLDFLPAAGEFARSIRERGVAGKAPRDRRPGARRE